jgi:hypothetical protein
VEEPAFNKTEAVETVIFTTAFGVTFGLVTGHDLLFYSPAFELVAEHGVTNFVHPTAWVNTMPFLTGNILKYSDPTFIASIYGLASRGNN